MLGCIESSILFITAPLKMVANEVSAASLPWPTRTKLDCGARRVGSNRIQRFPRKASIGLCPCNLEMFGNDALKRILGDRNVK